ncbi:MAG: plasmid stabilization system protein [Verrucomicrobia bacterium]|nr:plasmid stabilization system protein [Verrucomicrobiota bacterium]
MNWQISIRAKAERDLFEASRWYEQQVAGLGSDFITEAFRAIQDLASSADRRPSYYRDFRRILVKRFPYKIFYLIKGDCVIIMRVLHAKQDHPGHL